MGVFDYWPNRITALRFVGALALFVILGWLGDHDPPERGPVRLAFWLFIVTAATDVLDGWLARRGNTITAFGRIADPFVDKVLVLGAMVFLAVMPWSKNLLPAWVVVVVLSREFLVTGIRGYVESLGGQFPADWFGKVKMVCQCVAVGIVLGLHAFDWSEEVFRLWQNAGQLFVWATLVTTVGSCLSYLFKTRSLLLERSR